MPVTRNDTGFSPGSYGASDANVPGVPQFHSNNQVAIDSSNNTLVLTSDQGGPASITIPDGCYDPDARATALEAALDADATLTGGAIDFTVAYDSTTKIFRIDAGDGHTIALTGIGTTSTAAEAFGFSADKTASQYIDSDDSIEGYETCTYTFDTNGNSDVVEYAIQVYEDGVQQGYLQEDGSWDASSTEDWLTHSDWDNGGADGRVTAIGLTDSIPYTFRVKARNEAGDETTFSALSSQMNSIIKVDFGPRSEVQTRECPTGNTKIKLNGVTDSDGTTYTILPSGNIGGDPEGYYGPVTFTFSLQNWDRDTSGLIAEFSEDNGATWNRAHATADTDGTRVNAGTSSEEITGLSTSEDGVEHDYVWDSYGDAGLSERKTEVLLRFTPKDADGDSGASRTTDSFVVNNRPAKVAVSNYDSRTYDKDTTPVFSAVMGAIRGGTKMYFRLRIYDPTGVLHHEASTASNTEGWEYEQSNNTWVQVPVAGVDSSYADGNNRVRYTVQSGDALTPNNDNNYEVYIEQAEVRDRD